MKSEKERRAGWAELTRKAVEGKARAAQEARELGAALRKMKERLEAAELDRDAAVRAAEDIVAQRDADMQRVRNITDRWYKGDVGALSAVAELHFLLGGSIATANAIERQRAVREAQLRKDA